MSLWKSITGKSRRPHAHCMDMESVSVEPKGNILVEVYSSKEHLNHCVRFGGKKK